jgi:hypothetical protein
MGAGLSSDAFLSHGREVRVKTRLIGVVGTIVALFSTAGAAWKY